MSHERLAALITTRLIAGATHPEDRTTHEAILSILQALDQGEVTEGQALCLLASQALG
jgi:hypothetical protein